MNYNILWIEDESDKIQNFIALGDLHGLNIIVKDNSEEGIKELKRRDFKFDSVILDAKVKLSKNAAPTLSGLRASRDYLLGLKGEHFIPYFIYTGQPDYQETPIFKESFGKFYVKGKDDQNLIIDILKAIKDRTNTLIRRGNSQVFQLFENGFIDSGYEKHLLNILKSINADEASFDDELYFNQLRQILEVIMRRANEAGILHDKCINDKGEVILILSSLFLSGYKVDVLDIECKKIHLPKIISNHIREIIDITNIGSHTDKDGREQNEANLKEYRKKLNTPYLLYSLTFKLIDVLLWFSEYIKENNNIELNKSFWVDTSIATEISGNSDKSWKKGTVTRIAENGWGTFIPDERSETISIPDYMVRDNNIEEYQKIEVSTKPNSDGTKLHIDSIRIQS